MESTVTITWFNLIVYAALSAIVLLGGAYTARRLWAFTAGLKQALVNLSPAREGSGESAPAAADAAPILASARALAATLAGLDQDSAQATSLILDAQTRTETLVSLVKAISQKAEQMEAEAAALQTVLTAISTADPLAIVQAAGGVKDPHIRSLLLADVKAPSFWENTARLVATQVGSLSLWQESYHGFAARLLADVSESKTRLSAHAAALELTAAARPLAEVHHNLSMAQGLLQLQRRPALAAVTRDLPALNAGLK